MNFGGNNMIINQEYAEYLSCGSEILGFGGGGNAQEGLAMAEAAFALAEQKGHPIELLTIEELADRHPEGGTVVTISGVGSPASDTAYTPPEYYPRLMELLEKEGCTDIIGFISCEIGASSSFEPFLPAAMLGVPVIDAPCDSRAHPLGMMGALALEQKNISVLQVCVGGRKGDNGTAGAYVELSVRGSVCGASSLIRNAASLAGGAVSVARNPIDLFWLNTYGAKGAYAHAAAIGKYWKSITVKNTPAAEAAAGLADALDGNVICLGQLVRYSCVTENALDYGEFTIVSDGAPNRCQSVTITFFNEYMTLTDNAGTRHYTFPDGIVVIGEDLKIYSSAMLAGAKGGTFAVVAAGWQTLNIPPALRQKSHYRTVESVIGKDMISHLDDGTFFLDV